MALSDELAYMSASELALRVRRRDLSPVEVVDAFITRIEARNPSINAFVYLGFDDARQRAKEAEQALMSGAALGPLHGVPVALKDLFDFKPGWVSTFGGVRALKNNVVDFYCAFAERIEKAGAIIVGKTNSPVMGFRGTCDNYLFGPSRNPFNPGQEHRRVVGRQRRSRRRRHAAAGRRDRRWRLHPHSRVLVRRLRVQAVVRARAVRRPPQRLRWHRTVPVRGPDHPHGRGCRARPDRARGLRFARSPQPRRAGGLHGRHPALDPRLEDRVQPGLRRVPDGSPGDRCRRRRRQGVRGGGAHVEEIKVGIKRPQKELSDLWCRLIMPLNVQTFEIIKRAGLDLLKDHRDDFPPEYLRWIDAGYRMSALDFFQDQEVRTEIYDAIQGVLNRYDLLITPTLACLPVDNADDGNTMGPTTINGEEVT